MSLPRVTKTAIEEAFKLLVGSDIPNATSEEFTERTYPIIISLLDEQPELTEFFESMAMCYELRGEHTVPVSQIVLYSFIVMQAFKNQEEIDKLAKLFGGENAN